MEDAYRVLLGLVLLDILDDKVTEHTVLYAMFLSGIDGASKYDFITMLAGAPEDVNYTSLREVALEGLIYDLKGGDNGLLDVTP